MTPLTPAGQALLDLLHTVSPGAHYSDMLRWVERQAADRALAELRRKVEDLRYRPEQGMDNEMELHNATLGQVAALIDKASKPEEGA